MQWVGATEELIQAPFVVEGMIQGIIGAGLSLFGLVVLMLLVRDQLPISIDLFGSSVELQFIDWGGIALI